jgi:surface antigen
MVAEQAMAARPHHPANQPAHIVTPQKHLPIAKISTRTVVSSKLLPRTARISTGKQALMKGGKARYASRSYGGISCVPFARAASGIQLKGNAANWWDNAGGIYARGHAPEDGSVLNFRATGHMRLGHVAVVSRVLSAREIEIDHANWAGPGASKGGVSRGVSVIDVSANNDWSAVRVGLGHSGNYGSVYPTYGFIYDRPDTAYATAAPARGSSYDEVAEAPARALR